MDTFEFDRASFMIPLEPEISSNPGSLVRNKMRSEIASYKEHSVMLSRPGDSQKYSHPYHLTHEPPINPIED